jgi:uncharacterized protein (DUF433 family)
MSHPQSLAPPRAIVRDPLILGGRWCLDGTTLAVAEIRADYHAVPKRRRTAYRYQDVTADELEAVLGFSFPMIRATQVNFLYGAVIVVCECGEDTPAALTAIQTEPVHCVCGRKWWIRISVERDGAAAFDGHPAVDTGAGSARLKEDRVDELPGPSHDGNAAGRSDPLQLRPASADS